MSKTENNELLSLFDDENHIESNQRGIWKVLIVDDEKPVHSITKIILDDFEFNNKRLKFFSAFSEKEARLIMSENSDISLILLDVVMECEDSGLKLVKYIRDELKNKLVRIILRTGQPGIAPERKIILDYDINDYKIKTELTSDRLFVSVIAALRSYEDLISLAKNKHGLEQVIKVSTNIFNYHYFKNFTSDLLLYIKDIVSEDLITYNDDNQPSLLVLYSNGKTTEIVSSTEKYSQLNFMNLEENSNDSIMSFAKKTLSEKKNQYTSSRIALFIESETNHQYLYIIGINSNLTEWEKYLLDILTTNLSICLNNICLNNEMELTQKEIIFTLGEVAEARSKETGNHVKQVAEYAKILALNYGLSKEEAELIWLASPVHDIGKLAIPDNILNKPGKLTVEEFEIIKTHSTIGYEMLKNSNRLIIQAAAIIALQHHERYDGTGYPSGLKCDKIHIYGRITALADVFDALGSNRVYKKAWGIDEIIEYIKSQSGKQFEPKIVDVFIKSIDEFIKVKNTN